MENGFNPDATKQLPEVIFSRKCKNTFIHPLLLIIYTTASQMNSKKHLGVILNFELSFEEQLLNVFKKN